MKEIPIVFTFDSRVILSAATAIKSLLNSAGPETAYDIYVLHGGLKKKYQDALAGIVGAPHKITFKPVDRQLFKGLKRSSKSWPEIVYYRMLIPEILPHLDKALYSDADVYFKADMAEAFETNIDGYCWGGVKAEVNAPNSISHKYFPENKNDFIFFSGFMLINCKKCREENFFSRCVQTAIDLGDRLKYFDLDVLNVAAGKIAPMPFKYCVLEVFVEFEKIQECRNYKYLRLVYTDEELEAARKNPAIIHYAGQLGKPWRRKKPPKYWADCAGSLPKVLQKYTLRDLRKKFFSKI